MWDRLRKTSIRLRDSSRKNRGPKKRLRQQLTEEATVEEQLPTTEVVEIRFSNLERHAGSTIELADERLPSSSWDMGAIELVVTSGETQRQRIFDPEIIDASSWAISTNDEDSSIFIDVPDDLPQFAELTARIEVG